MAQSLAKVAIHLIFSTKHRERLIRDDIRSGLHAYMSGTLRELGSPALTINTEPDHAHVLFLLSRTATVSDVIGTLKKYSTLWLREKDDALQAFSWQAGYAAFSVSESNLDSVREYIHNQREHHRVRTFQDELRAFFHRHKVEFDERYVWD